MARSEVKIWKNLDIQLQPTHNGPYSKKEGPFFELGKRECSDLSAAIKEEIDKQVDWENPDDAYMVTTRFNEPTKVCKFSGK